MKLLLITNQTEYNSTEDKNTPIKISDLYNILEAEGLKLSHFGASKFELQHHITKAKSNLLPLHDWILFHEQPIPYPLSLDVLVYQSDKSKSFSSGEPIIDFFRQGKSLTSELQEVIQGLDNSFLVYLLTCD